MCVYESDLITGLRRFRQAVRSKFSYVESKRAIDFYATKAKLAKGEKKTIRDYLELVKFCMSSTMITFQDRYYECGGQ